MQAERKIIEGVADIFIGRTDKNVTNGNSSTELTKPNEERICRLQTQILWRAECSRIEIGQQRVDAVG